MTVSTARPHPGAAGPAADRKGFSPTRMMKVELVELLPAACSEGLGRRQRLSMLLGPAAHLGCVSRQVRLTAAWTPQARAAT
jgi:hypothetical protein